MGRGQREERPDGWLECASKARLLRGQMAGGRRIIKSKSCTRSPARSRCEQGALVFPPRAINAAIIFAPPLRIWAPGAARLGWHARREQPQDAQEPRGALKLTHQLHKNKGFLSLAHTGRAL